MPYQVEPGNDVPKMCYKCHKVSAIYSIKHVFIMAK